MHKALEQKLVERWPTWFNTGGDVKQTLMSFGFQHDDGWFDILCRLCEDLEPRVAEFERATGLQFEILQVKEKFGGLRFHVNDAIDAIRQRIEVAIQESFVTCELRGQPQQSRRRMTGAEPLPGEPASGENSALENKLVTPRQADPF
jgi:hypothetical protein